MKIEALQAKFVQTPKYKKLTWIALLIGVLSLTLGFVVFGTGDKVSSGIFWAGLLHNSMYALLVVNSAMLMLCIATLAMGGWITVIRRIPEAISALVPIIGLVTFLIFLGTIFTHQSAVYPWLDEATVKNNHEMHLKSIFLNPINFIGWSFVSIAIWSLLGAKMRQLSFKIDAHPLQTIQEKKKYIFVNTVIAAVYVVFFGLTVGSSLLWMWLMSIDTMWFSTLYSWYVFISSFTAGLALVTMYVTYLKKEHVLQLANDEHVHDLAKFIFGFSFLWAYFWFDQYMLIWYANIPEETIYYKNRLQTTGGHFLFYLNFIINFIIPFLLLMTRMAKRQYSTVMTISFIVIIGHWLDFYLLIFPSITTANNLHFSWYDIGLFIGFIGLVMYCIGKQLEKHNLVASNHPYFKESVLLRS